MTGDSDCEGRSVLPVVQELTPAPDPVEALKCFSDLDGTLLLESVVRGGRHGRYSFLSADPFRWFEIDQPEFGSDPFAPVKELLEAFRTSTVAGMPPFQGGVAGLLSYELGQCWERLPSSRFDDFRFPVLAIGAFDWTIAWDHQTHRCWIISQGFPASTYRERHSRATQRIEWVLARLRSGAQQPFFTPTVISEASICPQETVESVAGVTSTFSRSSYVRAVNQIIRYVRAGDIFQANLTQRMLFPTSDSPLDNYIRLRHCNPAPFAGYFANQDWAVLSSSPERFLRVADGRVETRPIKGTRRRSEDLQEDDKLKRDLLGSVKDRAENVMIVDLMRNDLSRVCRPGSVQVPELCLIETYETVHHLVSSVVGKLEDGKSAIDLFEAAFPGGSITGAPKVRAMEILAELEPVARGPYCGSLFYVGFDGNCDSSILIRTMLQKGSLLQFGVGGGITASSDPEAEYRETLDKAEGMLRLVRSRAAGTDKTADDTSYR